MTPETIFMQQLTHTTGTTLNPALRKQVRKLLRTYRNTIRKRVRESLPYLTDLQLRHEAIAVCNKYGITHEDLTRSRYRKAPTGIVEARKELTQQLMSKYRVGSQRLGKYLGDLDHATILYYLND